MTGFRAEYDGDAPLMEGEDFILEVIGFHQALPFFWPGRETIPSHRLMIFHDPVIIDYGEKQYSTKMESIVYFPPDKKVSYGKQSGEWSHSWLRFRGNYFADLLKREGLVGEAPLETGNPGIWESWLLQLYSEMSRVTKPDSFIIKGILQLLARQIHRETGNSESRDKLLEAKQQLDSRYTEKFSTAELAEQTGMGESYFCALFKDRWSMSPLEYRLSLRIRKAQELLKETELPIGSVGDLCGFSDPYYFSKVFKREAGVSPRNFRRS